MASKKKQTTKRATAPKTTQPSELRRSARTQRGSERVQSPATAEGSVPSSISKASNVVDASGPQISSLIQPAPRRIPTGTRITPDSDDHLDIAKERRRSALKRAALEKAAVETTPAPSSPPDARVPTLGAPITEDEEEDLEGKKGTMTEDEDIGADEATEEEDEDEYDVEEDRRRFYERCLRIGVDFTNPEVNAQIEDLLQTLVERNRPKPSQTKRVEPVGSKRRMVPYVDLVAHPSKKVPPQSAPSTAHKPAVNPSHTARRGAPSATENLIPLRPSDEQDYSQMHADHQVAIAMDFAQEADEEEPYEMTQPVVTRTYSRRGPDDSAGPDAVHLDEVSQQSPRANAEAKEDDYAYAMPLEEEELKGDYDYDFNKWTRYCGPAPEPGRQTAVDLLTRYRHKDSTEFMPIPRGFTCPRWNDNQEEDAAREMERIRAEESGTSGSDFSTTEKERRRKAARRGDAAGSDSETSFDEGISDEDNRKGRKAVKGKGKAVDHSAREDSSASKSVADIANPPLPKQPATLPTAAKKPGRPSKEQTDECLDLGNRYRDEVDALAAKWNTKREVVMRAAGLGGPSVQRERTPWNMFQQMISAERKGLDVGESKAWKDKVAADFKIFKETLEGEEKTSMTAMLTSALRDLLKDSTDMSSDVAKMMSTRKILSRTVSALADDENIHVIAGYIYSGPNSAARGMGGMVTDDPLVWNAIKMGRIDVDALLTTTSDLLRGLKAQSVVHNAPEGATAEDKRDSSPLALARSINNTRAAFSVEKPNRAQRLKEDAGVAAEERFSLVDVLAALRKKSPTGGPRFLVTSGFLIAINVHTKIGEKEKGQVPFVNMQECAVEWEWTMVGFPAGVYPIPGPTFNSQKMSQKNWKAMLDSMEAGTLMINRWSNEQLALEPSSPDYGEIPLIINSDGKVLAKVSNTKVGHNRISIAYKARGYKEPSVYHMNATGLDDMQGLESAPTTAAAPGANTAHPPSLPSHTEVGVAARTTRTTTPPDFAGYRIVDGDEDDGSRGRVLYRMQTTPEVEVLKRQSQHGRRGEEVKGDARPDGYKSGPISNPAVPYMYRPGVRGEMGSHQYRSMVVNNEPPRETKKPSAMSSAAFYRPLSKPRQVSQRSSTASTAQPTPASQPWPTTSVAPVASQHRPAHTYSSAGHQFLEGSSSRQLDFGKGSGRVAESNFVTRVLQTGSEEARVRRRKEEEVELEDRPRKKARRDSDN